MSKLYDAIRIDHFRGFESYWAVPYGDATAKRGRWIKGPGMDLVGILSSTYPDLRFIAEDLGYPTREVRELLDDSGFPGMRELASEGMTMVIVTHEMGFAHDVADRVVFIDDGVICEEGAPTEVLDHPQNPRTQSFLSKVL